MMRLYLDTQVKGQRLQVDAWVEVDDGRLATAMGRGEPPYTSMVWLDLSEIRVFAFGGKPVRLKDHLELDSTDLVLRLSGLECTLQPLPEG